MCRRASGFATPAARPAGCFRPRRPARSPARWAARRLLQALPWTLTLALPQLRLPALPAGACGVCAALPWSAAVRSYQRHKLATSCTCLTLDLIARPRNTYNSLPLLRCFQHWLSGYCANDVGGSGGANGLADSDIEDWESPPTEPRQNGNARARRARAAAGSGSTRFASFAAHRCGAPRHPLGRHRWHVDLRCQWLMWPALTLLPLLVQASFDDDRYGTPV